LLKMWWQRLVCALRGGHALVDVHHVRGVNSLTDGK
jgi:hypothetical protein